MASLTSTKTHEEVKFKFVVMQRRPLSSLPLWKRWLVRGVYFLVDWQTADGEELQAVCDTEATAMAIVMAGGDGWFYHRGIPLNVSLPADTCRSGGIRFPLSEAAAKYKKRGPLSIICPHTKVLCRPHDSLPYSELQQLYNRLQHAANR